MAVVNFVDYNTKKEEEIMELSEFAAFASSAADELINEKGPFNDPDEADGFCAALSELGMVICTPLANKEWIGYVASEEKPVGGLDAYANNTVCTNLMDFMNVIIGYGTDALTDANGPFLNPKAADDLCNRLEYDANNKLCIPLANDWWLVYSVYQELPNNGLNVLDVYRYMVEAGAVGSSGSEANQNG